MMKSFSRKSSETDIEVLFERGGGTVKVNTNYPFLSHMLETFACHGSFGLRLRACGDIEVDPHHMVEDCGYCLGRAVAEGSDGMSIVRSGSCIFPMDDALALVALDICGRPWVRWEVEPEEKTVAGGTSVCVFREFFRGYARGSGSTVHVILLGGQDAHHSIEAVFKAFGRALCAALGAAESVLTTKGVMDD